MHTGVGVGFGVGVAGVGVGSDGGAVATGVGVERGPAITGAPPPLFGPEVGFPAGVGVGSGVCCPGSPGSVVRLAMGTVARGDCPPGPVDGVGPDATGPPPPLPSTGSGVCTPITERNA